MLNHYFLRYGLIIFNIVFYCSLNHMTPTHSAIAVLKFQRTVACDKLSNKLLSNRICNTACKLLIGLFGFKACKASQTEQKENQSVCVKEIEVKIYLEGEKLNSFAEVLLLKCSLKLFSHRLRQV